MAWTRTDRDLVLGITPFHEPHAGLVVAIERAGGLGVLDPGPDEAAARAALDRVRSRLRRPFGVRMTADSPLSPGDLPPEVDTVLIDPALPAGDFRCAGRVLAEVTSPAEARDALRRGATGLVARGFEAGGRVGELSTFVLLQRLLAEFSVPVWAAGGIGPHTAAAAVAGGARGVVLDAQLALVAETELPAEVRAAIAAMDGSETRVLAGQRVYTRPDLPAIDPADGHLGARDLRRQLLPIGQDGALAAPLAGRYRTAGGVVQAIGSAITAQIALAADIEPLTGAVPVQGPMTRVSDRPEFAAAVAGAGGLPFLALALMPGREARQLLAETARLLGDLPWGVGILGFAPQDVRGAQLDAIRAVRPPCALIAGGNPAQARMLQEAGIETFLHVPSPGLLDQFLADGARRFVFEGAECGGHTGPRGSFALWEAQISRLLEFGDLTGARLWFAGGVQDERSAAMVAAMAAPLADRGARVSVLMGTAYLFTEEAVRSGAISPGYQQVARDCRATALLETSPGHVVRCADTGYVTDFARARQRLADDGVSQQEAWAELEQLNLGRLRIAAKGLRREGDALVAVDEGTARAEGMFMLGEAATLRSGVTTAAALHQQVTQGAGEFLSARAAALRATGPGAAGPGGAGDVPGAGRPLDVAIVGMACVFPGAGDLGAYWSGVLAGTDALGDVPPDRWRAETHPGLPSARGGFLGPVPFDALAYGIPPSSLASIEPGQLLALEVAARALADAGYDGRPFDRARTSVIFGAEAGSDLSAAYGLRSALPAYTGPLPGELDEHLPALTEDSFPGVLSNVIAGRIANRLDLGGVNYTVDAACASSLAAVDLACKELATGSSAMVLCGGVDTHNGAHDFELFAAVHALSPSGRCATFDARADGIALGEGAACVVLKRLADAERDGDRVYAVIKGVGGASDGRSLGLTAPRPEGQRLALDRAYAMAGVSPADVGLIEAHGTGTVVGDRTELATLTTLFTENGAAPGSCAIGSVKSQIGHTKCAAGLAGLIKVTCALHAGARPGTINLTEPNPFWEPGSSPFTFSVRDARPWPSPPGRRYAGVSAFGFGGANFHALLAGYDGADEPRHGLRDWPAELFVLRGDPGAAAARLRRLAADNEAAGLPWPLASLAATMAAGTGPVRAAFVAASLDDLAARLREPLPEAAPAADGTVAFLFPGQGSQRPGMLGDLLIAFPRLQRYLRLGDGRYAGAMFPPSAFTPTDRERRLAAITDTRVAQPALGIAGLALHELLTVLGVRPGMAAGHSYGELLALCAAGAYSETDLLELSAARAEAILAAAGQDPGAMASVSAPAPQVSAMLDGAMPDGAGVVVANYNAPAQTVVSGPTPAIEAALETLAARGVPARRIPVACAFHSPLVAGAAAALAAELGAREVRPPRFPVFANATAAPYPASAAAVREVLAGQVAQPVRFAEQIEAMYAAGARTFVEAGPGRVLTGLVGQILAGRPHTAVACDVPGENGLSRFLAALAELIQAGVPVDPSPLFAGRAEPVQGTPRRVRWTVDGHLVRTADGQPMAGGLRPASSAPRLSVGDGTQGMQGTPGAGPEAMVAEFLRTTRELMAAQRDVLLGYLGAYGPARTPAAVPVPAAAVPVPAAAVPVPAAVPPGGHPGAADPVEPAELADIGETVVAMVSARTGYPREMLAPDLDLEADLSIDSIKRAEIIGALAERLGLPRTAGPAGGSVIDQLAQIKTISGVTSWLTEHASPPAPPAAPAPESPPALTPASWAPSGSSAPSAPSVPEASAATMASPGAPAAPDAEPAGRPRRYLLEAADLGPPAAGPVPSGRFLLVDDGRGIALELADLLEQHGAETVTVAAPAAGPLARCDAVVHLGALRPDATPVLPAAFGPVRSALTGRVRTLLVATAAAGTFGLGATGKDSASRDSQADLGLRGMIRAIAAEYPDITARAVDVDPKESPQALAAQLMAELADPAGPPVTGYQAGRRRQLLLRPAELAEPSTGGPGLDAGSVVLLTGGARGITAAVALALARATGCHIELAGRTPPPGPADPGVPPGADAATVRRILIERGLEHPREIEAAVRRLAREQEIRATLDGLREAAASVRYHAVDVRDADAVTGLLGELYARYGRLDGVIHGAGLVEDRLVPDKTDESFARVFGTKVGGAQALASGLHPGTRFLVLFGSVSGVFGNRGQVDYAAANDALDTLAHQWNGHRAARVLTVDWGPWAGGGMVSAELRRAYARRGVTLIDPREGVACLLGELALGSGPAQVVYQCGEAGDG